MEFLEKINQNPYEDLYWNIPEGNKQGSVAVIGGNAQSFRTEVSVGEFLSKNYPIKEVRVAVPDALKDKVPPIFVFLKSTDSGSFSDGEEIARVITGVDFSIITGDLSKNAITKRVIMEALKLGRGNQSAFDSSDNRGDNRSSREPSNSNDRSAFGFSDNRGEKPVLITRDTVDLIVDTGVEEILMRPELIILGSLPQWQKIFRAVYYPKILTLSQPLTQVAEALHKFTLSYPIKGITVNNGQILVFQNGRVVAVEMGKTRYTPISVWSGELAAAITAVNLYNPGKFIEATVAALFK